MKDLTTVYTEGYYKARQVLGWRAPILSEMLTEVFSPFSVVDFGCGCGDFACYMLDNMGLSVLGIEGTKNAKAHTLLPDGRLRIFDMRFPMVLEQQFSIATCWNVLPHIEERFSVQALKNMMEAADVIVFNAYEKQTSGYWDANCQPRGYWESILRVLGCSIDEDAQQQCRKFLTPWAKKTEIARIRDNLFVARR